MKDASGADVSFRPSKNKMKGKDPPRIPITTSFNRSFRLREKICFHLPKSRIVRKRQKNTKRFFEAVNREGFIPDTPNLFKKIENPLTKAVSKTKSNPVSMDG